MPCVVFRSMVDLGKLILVGVDASSDIGSGISGNIAKKDTCVVDW
jgi:hypothetical protein